MSDAPPKGFDDFPPSPFRARHDELVVRGVQRHIPREVHRRQLLFGPGRAVKFPLVALTTQQDMGDVRHALSQRTVAGTAEVTFPFAPERVPPATPPHAPPDAT